MMVYSISLAFMNEFEKLSLTKDVHTGDRGDERVNAGQVRVHSHMTSAVGGGGRP